MNFSNFIILALLVGITLVSARPKNPGQDGVAKRSAEPQNVFLNEAFGEPVRRRGGTVSCLFYMNRKIDKQVG